MHCFDNFAELFFELNNVFLSSRIEHSILQCYLDFVVNRLVVTALGRMGLLIIERHSDF